MALIPLTKEQLRALAALGDVFWQALPEKEEKELVEKWGGTTDRELLTQFCRSKGSDFHVAEQIEKTFLPQMRPDNRFNIQLVTTLLSSSMGTLLLLGVCGPFADLSPEKQEAALKGLQESCIGEKRKIFVQLKSVTMMYTLNRSTLHFPKNAGLGKSIGWEPLGYEGPASREEAENIAKAAGRDEHVFATLNSTITGDTELKFDAVVIGSGCGGGVVAGELAAAGHSVLVLEKAEYFQRSRLTGEEEQAFGFFDQGGSLYTEDKTMAVLGASAFGGGTLVNWACCLKPPLELRKQWATEFGLEQFVGEGFEASLDAIWKRLSVKSGDDISHNRSNQLLLDGCKKLGYLAGPAGQNMADTSPFPPGAGFINNGDRYGLKQSMLETYLRDAATAEKPAQFLDRCFVEKVLHEKGVAVGVRARVTGSDGATHMVTVKAPVVVVSGGSLQSPLLLARSGMPNRNGQVGKNLHLHPVQGVLGFLPDSEPEVNNWRGAPMTAVCSVPALHGDGYGCKLEVPAVHPGISSTMLPWLGGKQFKKLALNMPRVVPFIALSRDKCSGEVWGDKDGFVHVSYSMDRHCEEVLMDGVIRNVRALEAIGVEQICVEQLGEPKILPPTTDPKGRERVVDEIVAGVQRIRFSAGRASLFSAHQMGTCRMGVKAENSVVKPTCESWEISGLYVVDASTFPTASGVNPMVTTLGIAHFAAQGLKERMAKVATAKE